ncbi:MAG: phosphoribosyl-ATP diphosphatase [Rhizobiales bacterium]|jgi:phosphoribosyl-ATP pyrophosphohydrolase|nr:phosphoribosyl-ATP diphosphatase [Hyphomicrobiales bacterium]
MTKFTLEDLAKIIAARASESADKSYTRKLLDAGIEKCAKKLGEEATETVIAAAAGTKEQVVAESADLLYHLLVVLKARGVDLSEVYAELEKRTAQSGLEEKAARNK